MTRTDIAVHSSSSMLRQLFKIYSLKAHLVQQGWRNGSKTVEPSGFIYWQDTSESRSMESHGGLCTLKATHYKDAPKVLVKNESKNINDNAKYV